MRIKIFASLICTLISGSLVQAQASTLASEELHPRGVDLSATINKIAFSSCADQNQLQPIWKTIIQNQPDLFLFMGDTIYNMPDEPISAQYKKLDKISEYREAREKIPFLVMWDDNDFGQKDGGADFANKDEFRKDFLNYWYYIKDSIGLNQKGLFHSKIIGNKKKLVQIILLDARYYRSPLIVEKTETGKKYLPNADKKATVLGEEQWKWLETQLMKPAQVRFLVSTIQVLPSNHDFEKWGNFPLEKERLLSLIKKTKAKNLFILSGDRHKSTIAKEEIQGYGSLYEATASAINKSQTRPEEKDPNILFPYYMENNFGMANIDWVKKTVTFQIKNTENTTVQELSVKLTH